MLTTRLTRGQDSCVGLIQCCIQQLAEAAVSWRLPICCCSEPALHCPALSTSLPAALLQETDEELQAFGPRWLQESTQRAQQDATLTQAARSQLQPGQQATFDEGVRVSAEGWRPDRCASCPSNHACTMRGPAPQLCLRLHAAGMLSGACHLLPPACPTPAAAHLLACPLGRLSCLH